MYLTGFADEAAEDLATQIKATKELGWQWIESRAVDGVNLHDLEEPAFDRVCEQLDGSGVGINCFGSTIANWGCSVHDDFNITLERVSRAIPRMQRLNAKLIRIMSFKVEPDHSPDDQFEKERFAKLNEIVKRFTDAGLQPVHENCMNYGGMGWTYTLRMLDAVPGLKLVYDTGNPCFTPEYRKPEPRPRQSSFEFYSQVKQHIAYVHIKDGTYEVENDQSTFLFPDTGHGDTRLILKDLFDHGYDGGISIEPHMNKVFHEKNPATAGDEAYKNYVEYGQRLVRLIEEVRGSSQE